MFADFCDLNFEFKVISAFAAMSTPLLIPRILYLIAGWLFVIVGVVGIYLPLLPTTPFLLLAAACFHRSSPKFHAWLVSHRVLGPPILDWQKNRVIRPQTKALACAMIAVSSFFFLTKPTIPIVGKCSYVIVITCVVGFLVSRKGRP